MTEAQMIAVNDEELVEVRRILRENLPGWEVRAFGSRVTGQAKSWSDLDLVVMAPARIHWNELGRVKEVFQESDLPFRVELLDWNDLSPAFQAVIAQGYAVVQPSSFTLTA